MNAYLKFLEKILPATICIKANIPESHPTSSILGTERMGSGTIIDKRGFLLTVGYVVLGASNITVTLLDGRDFPASVVFHDFESGISVLRIRGANLSKVTLGKSQNLKPGESVLILGSTNRQERRVSDGLITSTSPFDAYWEYMLDRAIFTTAINPGFGGGALIDYSGKIVGVVSLNLGFIKDCSLAIPIEYFLNHHQTLLAEDRVIQASSRAWVGFYVMPSYHGVLVYGLVPGAPAETAGLKTGDIILNLDSYEVGGSRVKLYKELWKRRAGDKINFTVVRQGKLTMFTVVCANRAQFYA